MESLESDVSVNISKEAAKGVINLLTPRDQVGISAGYGNLAIPMQYVTNKAAIDKSIDAMNPDDPASYNPDLANAEQVLLHTNAKIKHVILLGDGDAFDNYAPQTKRMALENISISTVATNSASIDELNTMINIASWGRGRFYRADDPSSIPQVLLKETERAARRTIINETFTPAVIGSHPLLTGLTALPSLDGYVATTPKPNAQMILVSHRDDPVLAAWQYGLGRAVAWTSDDQGLWTTNWLQWKDAARWWANLVTWTLPTPDSALNINSKVVNGTGQLTVDLPAGTTTGVTGTQQVQARIIAPDHSQETAALQPTAPERWEGNFPALQVGAYLIQVTWKGQGSNKQLTSTSGLIVPYSPEYTSTGTDTTFLKRLAQAGNGTLLNPQNTAATFTQNLVPVSAALPLTFLLLVLAALLLPVDIAVRRLSGIEFLTESYRWLLARLPFGKSRLATSTAEAEATAMGTPLSSLRARREVRRKSTNPIKLPTKEMLRDRSVERAPTKARLKTTTKTTSASPAEPETLMTEQLLEAKRRRGKSE